MTAPPRPRPYEPQFTCCYTCKVKIPYKAERAPLCDRCWDDNLKLAAAGWVGAEKLTRAS